MEPPDGARLVSGRYRLGELLGKGGMGTVWRATDELLGRDVALKRLRLADLPDDEIATARERIMREARIAAALHHPQIVTIFDVVVEDAEPWLVLEYLPSVSLGQMLRDRGPLPPEEVAAIGAQMAGALAVAHAAGIVHRDVKPDNVLVAGSTAKLTDFGISYVASAPSVTQTGVLTGTPAYLAPETCRGEGTDPRSDVYALGATLYAAVEGAPPFGSGGDVLALIGRIAYGQAPAPQRAGRLADVLRALLVADPRARPSAAQTRDMLIRMTPGWADAGTVAAAATQPGAAAAVLGGAPPAGAAGAAPHGVSPHGSASPGVAPRGSAAPGAAPHGSAPAPAAHPGASAHPRRGVRRLTIVAAAVVGVAGLATAAVLVMGLPGTGPDIPTATASLGDPRTADPCSLIDTAALARHGAVTVDQANVSFNGCRADLRPPDGNPLGVFVELTLSVTPRFQDEQQVGEVVLHRLTPAGTVCARELVLPDRTVVAVYAQRSATGTADLCAVADTATLAAADILNTRGTGVREPLDVTSPLAGVDACSLFDAVDLAAVQGTVSPGAPGFGGWSCSWGRPSGLSVYVNYDRGRPPDPTRPTTTDIAGRTAATAPDIGRCRIELVQRRYSGSLGERADLVQITVYGADDDVCAQATALATAAARKLPPAG